MQGSPPGSRSDIGLATIKAKKNAQVGRLVKPKKISVWSPYIAPVQFDLAYTAWLLVFPNRRVGWLVFTRVEDNHSISHSF